jgi:hypothetical protein
VDLLSHLAKHPAQRAPFGFAQGRLRYTKENPENKSLRGTSCPWWFWVFL